VIPHRAPDPDYDAHWTDEDDVTIDQYRIIGRLEAQMGSAEERLDRIEAKLDTMLETVTQFKGGWKVLAGVAAAGSAIGISVTKLIALLKGGQ